MSEGGWAANSSSPEEAKEGLTTPSVLATSVLLAATTLVTIVGNLFVMLAILLDRHLQSVANYLILSLAVTDLLVACLVMPLSAVYEVTREWVLGPGLCDMWTISDVLCCTASILHLVAIALDRYWAVTNVHYIRQRSSNLILAMIFVIWTMSALVSFAPLLGWKDSEWNARVLKEKKCMVSQDPGYQIFATLCTFYVPLAVILCLYWRIYEAAKRRIRKKNAGRRLANIRLPLPSACMTTNAMTTATTTTTTATTTTTTTAPDSSVLGEAPSAPFPDKFRDEDADAAVSLNSSNVESVGTVGPAANGIFRMTFTFVESVQRAADREKGTTTTQAMFQKRRDTLDNKRERKAAKTLAIITGVFVVCWLPFFVTALLMPLCKSCALTRYLTSLFLWLGYFNSTLNPVIYTIFNPEFRNAFRKLLLGRRYGHRMRTKRILKQQQAREPKSTQGS